MLLLLSPAKIMNLKSEQLVREHSQPEFLKEADSLVAEVRQLSAYDISQLLCINTNLAQQNADRYFNWHLPFTEQNAKQAVFVYNGEVFHGLDARSLSTEDFAYMQSHLRILSGLYGILRPWDLIQPYRLEISTKLQVGNAKDIYSFWGDKITQSINNAFEKSGKPNVLLNLASGEYFKSINRKLLQAEVIDFDFLNSKNDEYKPIVVYIKKARGMMARYVIENRIDNIEDLKGFSAEGYWFSERLSTANKFVFTRG